MTSIELNTYVTFGYLATGVLCLMLYVSRSAEPLLGRLVFGALILVFGLHTAGIGLRWVESYQMGIGHAPLSNFYESVVFFAWALALALIVIRLKFHNDLVVLVGLPLVFLCMASTSLLDPTIKPLIPALQSNWLVAHVITCFLGYAGFAVSFVSAVLLLISGNEKGPVGRFFPKSGILDEIVYRSVLAGFPLLTIGIITGSAWADYAWGSYWSWDPKETWSLITWLIYAAFLHARLVRGWSGRKTALLSMIGFAAVLFTYLGVNYLPGLHSYF